MGNPLALLNRKSYMVNLISEVAAGQRSMESLIEIARSHRYSQKEYKDALAAYNQSIQSTPAPQPSTAPPNQRKVAAMHPLQIGKLPAPSDALEEQVHQLGEKIAAVATRFKQPLVYDRARSRKAIRVQRLTFAPSDQTDLAKVPGLANNFVGHAGMDPDASILVLPGRVEIHNPIPGDQWERPHFKQFVAKVNEDQQCFPAAGIGYTVGVDLDGKALRRNEVIGLLVSGYKGSGKSQHLRSLISETCLAYKPKHVKFALFDIQGATFQDFKESPWCWMPPCLSDTGFANDMDQLLKAARRREVMFRQHGVSNINQWNRKFPEHPLCRVIVVLDEFGETVFRLGKKLANEALAAISRASRKYGFDVIIATQIPRQDDFEVDLLRNLGDRVVFQAADIGASYTAFGYNEGAGATLQGKGDGFLRDGGQPIRFQSLWLGNDDGEKLISDVIRWGRSEYGLPDYGDRFPCDQTETPDPWQE